MLASLSKCNSLYILSKQLTDRHFCPYQTKNRMHKEHVWPLLVLLLLWVPVS